MRLTRNLQHSNPHWQSIALDFKGNQTKLSVSKPGDAHEQEADQVADQVMRSATPNSKLGRNSSNENSSATAPTSVEPIFHGHGQPLNPDTRSFMESRLGHDFSNVRMHTDPAAASTALALDARAFTAGQNIGFAAGEFAPETHQGQRLIAHELAHVIQGSTSTTAGEVIRRKPSLSGRKTTEHVADSIAGDVDKALAESAIIKKFVDVKALKKTKGHLSVDVKEVYESLYQDYAKKYKGMPDVKDVPGFTDRDKGQIELRLHSADIEAALHEGIHLNSAKMFQDHFGHPYNEGVTEYFTEKVLAEQKTVGGARAYRSELKIAEALIAVFDEDQLGKAYFKGDTSMYRKVVAALNKSGTTDFSTWYTRINSDVPADWERSVEQLKHALGK